MVDSGDSTHKLTKDEFMRQIMQTKKCDPIILKPNGSIWKSECIYKICEHSNETKTTKEILLEKYKNSLIM